MSPMKNPKLSVAASSTKKPKMTFSRFMLLLPAASPVRGRWCPDVIKLSHRRGCDTWILARRYHARRIHLSTEN